MKKSALPFFLQHPARQLVHFFVFWFPINTVRSCIVLQGRVFGLLLAVGFLSGCDCASTTEESLYLTWRQGQPIFDSIKGMGANRLVNPLTRQKDQTRHYYFLPVDSQADTTTYIFYRGKRSDTLKVSYTRFFAYSDNCSFTLDLQKVKIEKSTLGQAAFRSHGVEGDWDNEINFD